MDHELLQNAEKFHKKQQHQKRWQKVLSVLGCIVVFCTTYALVLPAITEEKTAFCGLEEHTHEDACYEKAAQSVAEPVLICTQLEEKAHTHEEACYEMQGGHIHEDACYSYTRGELVCSLPEEPGHAHGDGCYGEVTLICTLQENHVHSDACFAADTLTCTESENHTHDDACVTVGGLLCAEPEGHIHSGACYEQILTCTEPESEGHTHENACYQQISTLICELEEVPGEQVLVCTEPETHVHEETCYAAPEAESAVQSEESDETLTCKLEESETHKHGDRCYGNWTLICNLEEHTHNLQCASDPSADLETAANWEKTFADVELSGVWADDVLAISETQMGYQESQINYIVPEDTDKMKGYTRYGAWYGDHYGDWCAMFVSFCLNYAEVDRELFPIDSNCQSWINTLTVRDLYRTVEEYVPIPGDLIFFDWDQDKTSDHVGIVKEIDPETGAITTIEGNNGLTVANFTYETDDEDVIGFGLLPENPELSKPVLAEQTLTAVIYTDGSYAEEAEDNTVITVSGMLPENAEARAYPVKLESETIDGRTVLLAYDISIFYGEDRLFESSEELLTVSIRPADWDTSAEPVEETEESEDDVTYGVYYIPEEGEPEPVETTADETAVNFQTDHFSTYALTAGGTATTIYLNGASGNDNNDGTRANTAVKTLEKAMALVKDGGTIYISGTVTVSDDQEWDVENKVTIKRYSSFTDALIKVADGGSLTLSNITINGGSGTPSSSNIATNSTYANNSAKAPLIVVNNSGRLTLQTGATLEYNSNKPDISNNKFVESGYIGLGGAVYCSGTLTMNGGLIQYCEAQCGGGVYVENGNFYLNGGTIDHNYARDIVSYKNRVGNYHKNAGGGVYVGDNSTMTMTGGTVSNNQSSREGGGISLGWLNRTSGAIIKSYITTFTMNGGTITGNYAVSTGGGLNITAGRQAFINAGYITYNDADGKEYQDSSTWIPNELSSYYTMVFSGGGVYIDAAQWSNYAQDKHDGVSGKAVINRALITQNTASNSGGGIAACATSVNFVYGSNTNGTAIYKNSSNEVYVYNGSMDMGDTVLGGGAYGWNQSGRTWDNSLTDNSSAIVTAKKLATVFITNNTGYLGGGIGCNGLIEIGGEEEESTYINIIKKWEDDGTIAHPEFIEVQVLQNGKPYGEPVRIYRTYDEKGNEVWPTFYIGGLPSGHKYTVQELDIPGYMATIEQDGQDFIITNKPVGYQVVKIWVDESGNTLTDNLPDSIKVQLYQNGQSYGTSIELNNSNNWTYTWLNLPKQDSDGNACTYSTKEVTVPEGFYTTTGGQSVEDGKAHVITNIKSPVTSISVEKQWAAGTPAADGVTVQLLRDGEPFGDPVTLNEGNLWFHKWENLPTKNTDGSTAVYTVAELNADGYDVTITDGVRSEIPKKWTTVSSLESGSTYLLVSDNGALAADSNGLSWITVTENLTNGTTPNSAALWTYKNSKLQSGSGRYLYLSSEGSILNPTYQYTSASSGSNINTFDGRISVNVGFLSSKARYFGTISGATASAVDSHDSATEFKAYVLTEGEDPCANWGDKHYVITNAEKKPINLEVNFAKYSDGTDPDGNPTLLAGAELALYKADDAVTDFIPGTNVTGTMIREWTSEIASTENPNGIHAETLFSGTYYLVETKAPDGHMGLSGPIVFEVDATAGTVVITSYPDRETPPAITGNVLPVYNAVMVTLPETGGMGTTLFYVLGGLLTAAAAILLITGKRMRKGA